MLMMKLKEPLTLNQWVPGSSPGGCTIYLSPFRSSVGIVCLPCLPDGIVEPSSMTWSVGDLQDLSDCPQEYLRRVEPRLGLRFAFEVSSLVTGVVLASMSDRELVFGLLAAAGVTFGASNAFITLPRLRSARSELSARNLQNRIG
jgi:hypothetical protein